MNVGFYRYSLFNRGGDRLSLAYANHLATAGHDVTLYVVELDTVFLMSPELKVVAVNCSGRAGFLMHSSVVKLKHDIVIIDIIHLYPFLSIRNSVLYYAQADDVEYYDSVAMRTLVDFAYRLYFRRENKVISMSQHLTDILGQRYELKNVYTINTGIDHGLFHQERDKELLGVKENRKAVILMARGDSFRKGFDLAMHVLEAIDVETAEKMELWVCGNHLDNDNFKFTTRNFGVVSDDRLRQILSSADIFFYPSRHEGFGLFPLEAMACGCIAITTEAIPYAAQSNVIFVSPVGDTDMILENLKSLLASTKDNLEALKERSIQYASTYDLKYSLAEFEQVLAEITGNS